MNWMRVGAAALVTGACALLVACGSGVVSSLDFQEGSQDRSDPASDRGRIMVVGDDFSDFGQNNGYVYTVRDGSRNWVQELAQHYGVTIKTANAGGWGYAQGHARVDGADTTSGTNAPSVNEQVTLLLSQAGGTLRGNDAVFINGGMWDIIDAVEGQNSAEAQEARDAVEAAARALATQVRRLVDAGAGHVAVTGVYDLGTSPWAAPWGRSEPRKGGAVTDLTLLFNNSLLLDLENKGGAALLYLDAAQFYRFAYDDDKHERFGISNRQDPFCPAPESMAGCDAPADSSSYDAYLFADDVHFTPAIWRWFGDDDVGENAYQRFSDRWGRP